MTDTASAAPSDAEIDAQWRESVEKHETTAAFVRDFARAVLAKWCAPPQISESDAAYWLRHRALILHAIEERGFRLVSSGGLFWLHGPSHPAQAGAAPLTPKQVAEIADAAHREYDRLVGSGKCAPRWSAVFAHLLERAHGIGIKNGGQHDAE